jgi:hypothetical protein
VLRPGQVVERVQDQAADERPDLVGRLRELEAGPRPDGSHVRVAQIQGRWLIELGPEKKGARVTYEVLSEPGGAIPTWVVNRVQGDAAASLVRAMLQRTRERAAIR